MRRVLVLSSIAILTLSACSADDGEPTDSVALDDQSANDDAALGSDDAEGAADEADAPTDSATGEDEPGDNSADDASADPDSQAPDTSDHSIDPGDEDSLADIGVAQPGTWPIGDAGTVSFDVVDGRLVLEDITEVDGWSSRIDDEDDDEIDIEFTQGSVSWRFEVELTDGGTTLEIELDLEDDNADPGSYDIGDAGTFAFEVAGSRLSLTDLSVADGWTVTDQDEDDDEFDFEVEQAERRFEVEVELDGGMIELEIDYTVTGSLS